MQGYTAAEIEHILSSGASFLPGCCWCECVKGTRVGRKLEGLGWSRESRACSPQPLKPAEGWAPRVIKDGRKADLALDHLPPAGPGQRPPSLPCTCPPPWPVAGFRRPGLTISNLKAPLFRPCSLLLLQDPQVQLWSSGAPRRAATHRRGRRPRVLRRAAHLRLQ